MNYFYNFSQKEKIALHLNGVLIVLVFAYFFYRSLWAVPLLIPLFFVYYRYGSITLILKKQELLRLHFKEVMELVSIGLKAGYSAENAFIEAHIEMRPLCGADSPMDKMLAFIKSGIENNIPIEKRIGEAGLKSGINEIQEFAGVFTVAKHNGGNMIETVERTASMIGEKIETEKEIAVLLSARKGEQKIMNIVPFFILLYLDITSPGYFKILYHNLSGVVIMTVCLVIYLLAFGLSVMMLTVEI
jgi:tight adherence protein B